MDKMTQRHTYTTEFGGSKRGPKACYVGALPCTISLTGTRKTPTEAEIGSLAMLLAMRRASSFLALDAEPDSIRMFRHPARHELKHGLRLTLFQRHVIL
jgi:hypothetical protein